MKDKSDVVEIAIEGSPIKFSLDKSCLSISITDHRGDELVPVYEFPFALPGLLVKGHKYRDAIYDGLIEVVNNKGLMPNEITVFNVAYGGTLKDVLSYMGAPTMESVDEFVRDSQQRTATIDLYVDFFKLFSRELQGTVVIISGAEAKAKSEKEWLEILEEKKTNEAKSFEAYVNELMANCDISIGNAYGLGAKLKRSLELALNLDETVEDVQQAIINREFPDNAKFPVFVSNYKGK